MKQGSKNRIAGVSGLAGLYLAIMAYAPVCTARDETPPTVNVGVHAQHAGDKIIYQYRVTNNTQQTVSAISIGRDSGNDNDPGNDIYELQERPSGWSPKFGIPAASYNAPTGWRANMVPTIEDAGDTATPHAITWEPLNDKTPKLPAGQSMSKLSITLDKADDNHLTGHAFINFADGNPAGLSVPLQRLDNTPPVLTVTLSPNTLLPQNDKPVAVRASFTVQDDFDRMPRIKLESITANEPLGADEVLDASPGLDDRYLKFRTLHQGMADRIYTVSYSATDASGNQTLASATVTTVAATDPAAASPTMPAPAK